MIAALPIGAFMKVLVAIDSSERSVEAVTAVADRGRV